MSAKSATLTTNTTPATFTTLAVSTLQTLQDATNALPGEKFRFSYHNNGLTHFSPQSCSGCDATPIRDKELVNKRELLGENGTRVANCLARSQERRL